MTEHDDAEFDAVIDAMARPDAPADHVARVLARTSAATDDSQVDAPRFPAAGLKPRWVLPVAATVLAVLGASWQSERMMRDRFDAVMTPANGVSVTAPAPAWLTPPDVDRPVLPPQAYWGMDPFQEFATLRPGTQEHRSTGTQEPGSYAQQQTRPDSNRASGLPGSSPLSPADDEGTWQPGSSGLPPIDVISIAAAPLLVPPVAALEEIAVAEIPLAPIVIAPLNNDEDRP